MVDSTWSTKFIYIVTSSRYWRSDQNQRGRNDLLVVDAADAGRDDTEYIDVVVVACWELLLSCEV